jgi:hypothetical protein
MNSLTSLEISYTPTGPVNYTNVIDFEPQLDLPKGSKAIGSSSTLKEGKFLKVEVNLEFSNRRITPVILLKGGSLRKCIRSVVKLLYRERITTKLIHEHLSDDQFISLFGTTLNQTLMSSLTGKHAKMSDIVAENVETFGLLYMFCTCIDKSTRSDMISMKFISETNIVNIYMSGWDTRALYDVVPKPVKASLRNNALNTVMFTSPI